MSGEADPAETRAALSEVEARLRREVADLEKILRADLPTHVERVTRSLFERSPAADAMEAAALTELKEACRALAGELADQVLAPFEGLSAWTWPSERTFPAEPSGLRDHPQLATVLSAADARLAEFLRARGLDPSLLGPEGTTYREPAYFVGGLYMKSVVANYWRALADYDALSRALADQEGAAERAARRRRWEDA